MEIYHITKSKIKISEEEFNNCPGKIVIKTILEDQLKGLYKIVDTSIQYVANDYDTLVFLLDAEKITKKGPGEVGRAIGALTKMANELGADEFNTYRMGPNNIVVRMWWD